MPRSFRVERESDAIFNANPFDTGSRRRQAGESMANAELVQNNQRLQARLQKLTLAYQTAEQQNVMLKDKCLRLQNRVDELKLYLGSIKSDVGERVAPLRLIAGHLFEVAAFLESLDNSIEMDANDGRRRGAGWSGMADARPGDSLRHGNLEPIKEDGESNMP